MFDRDSLIIGAMPLLAAGWGDWAVPLGRMAMEHAEFLSFFLGFLPEF